MAMGFEGICACTYVISNILFYGILGILILWAFHVYASFAIIVLTVHSTASSNRVKRYPARRTAHREEDNTIKEKTRLHCTCHKTQHRCAIITPPVRRRTPALGGCLVEQQRTNLVCGLIIGPPTRYVCRDWLRSHSPLDAPTLVCETNPPW